MILRVPFTAGAEALTPEAQARLTELARRLAGNEERINVKGYASGADDGMAARRMALTRALAVRRFLGDKDVSVARINVNAVGLPTDGGPADRVDIQSLGR